MSKERLLPFISPLILLAIWEVLARIGVIDIRFFPAPSEIFGTLIKITQDGSLLEATLTTLRRMLIGYVLAAIPAVLLGVLMGVNRFARLLFAPLINSLYPIPKIALVPMVILIFGISENAKYAVVIISVFFLVAINTMAGVLNLDPKYFDIARNNGARGWDLLWTVALPGSLPNILTGLNLGLGFALTVIVGTELLLPQGGLGAMIWKSYQIYDVPTIFAALIVVAVLGWGINVAMEELERQIIPWKALPQAQAKNLSANAKPVAEPRIRRFIRIWWMAARPFSFTASVTPVVLGSAIAAYDGFFNLGLFILTLVGSVAIHAGTNLINDYYDWKKGTDTAESLGPNRPLKEGLITPQQLFVAALLTFALGSAIGLYLVATRGVFILIIGVLSVLAGWFYTAGPFAFAYVGLGEVVVFIFMGPVMVLGSYYVMAQQWPWRVVWLAVPLGLIVASILHANNMRDYPDDLAKGKRTLANLLGRRASKNEFLLLMGGGFVVLGGLVLLGIAPWLTLITLFELPNAIKLIRLGYATEAPQPLNKLVRASAASHKRFGWLMIAGMIAAWVVRG